MAKPFASSIRSAVLALAAAVLLPACSYVLLPPNVRHVAPPSSSVADADAKLARAARERAAVEAEFAASEQVCYTRFFVNDCLGKAREKRRSELAVVRAVEIEAEYFKRKFKADERDRQLAIAEKEDQAREAELAARPPRAEPVDTAAPPPKPKPALVNREAAHAEKLKRQAEKDAATAAKRDENVRKFEEKRKESERRQAEREERRNTNSRSTR